MKMCRLTLGNGEVKEMTMEEFRLIPLEELMKVLNERRIIKTEFFEEEDK